MQEGFIDPGGVLVVLSDPSVVGQLVSLTGLPALVRSAVKAIGLLGVFFVVLWMLERRSGADRGRYLSRNFLHDCVYTLFYQGGFYNVFIYAAVANALQPRLAMFELDLLRFLPAPVDFVLYWIILDFLGYWVHRLEHANPVLWSFHSVHHSQERMTFLTTFRNHPVGMLIANLIMLIPVLVLGIPTRVWLILYVMQQAFEAVQHAELDWGYGRLYPIVVSPRFHAFHHGREARYHHRNYGKLLSVWDHVFGTATGGVRPSRFGVDGLPMRESLISQLVSPFRMIWTWGRSVVGGTTPAAGSVALTAGRASVPGSEG